MDERMQGRRATRRFKSVGGIALLVLAFIASVPVCAQMAGTAASDAAEQRRAREREQSRRQMQEQPPQERSAAPAPPLLDRLPQGEPACVTIGQLELRGEGAKPFSWVLDAVAGPDGNDSPLRKCLGITGIDMVMQRAQAALRARGFVTSRVLLQPQDLTPGTLALTVIPGRIRAIRHSAPADARIGGLNALPLRAGDILNTHDIEQALENFKRVPTASASIEVEGTDRPDLSDLVISYKAGFPFRMTLSIDDSGTRATGKYQGGVTLSYDNWWTLNDMFYVSVNHDLGGGETGRRGTRGGTVHYSLPLGWWSLSATASANRYFQTVAGASQDYIYSGTSRNAEVKLSRLLYRDVASKTTASLKAFRRESSNFIDDTEIEVQHRNVGGWEITMITKSRLFVSIVFCCAVAACGGGGSDAPEGAAISAVVEGPGTDTGSVSAPFVLGDARYFLLGVGSQSFGLLSNIVQDTNGAVTTLGDIVWSGTMVTKEISGDAQTAQGRWVAGTLTSPAKTETLSGTDNKAYHYIAFNKLAALPTTGRPSHSWQRRLWRKRFVSFHAFALGTCNDELDVGRISGGRRLASSIEL